MSDDIRLAIIVNPALPIGLVANTVGAVCVGLGARMPALGATQLADRQARRIDVSANRPVPVLQADGETIRAIMLKALPAIEERAVVPFPAFAPQPPCFCRLWYVHAGARSCRGGGRRPRACGPSKWIRSLTGSLKLLR